MNLGLFAGVFRLVAPVPVCRRYVCPLKGQIIPIVHRHAAKYLKRLPKGTKDRIKDILKQLENNPLKHSGIKQMFGEWARYHRIREGKLGVILFDIKEDIVYVAHIGPRKRSCQRMSPF